MTDSLVPARNAGETEQLEQIQRYLIVKYKIREDKKVDLWPKGMQHAELILFDVSDLQEARIDWEKVQPGIEHPCRFWAYWIFSEKLKTSGNPYKDVIRLEPLDLPATTTSTDTSAVVAELQILAGEVRAIKALLLAHVAPAVDNGSTELAEVLATDGDQVAAGVVANDRSLSEALFGPTDDPTADEYAHLAHLLQGRENGAQPPADDPHRARFYEAVAPALHNGHVHQDDIDAILADVNGHGWELAADCLSAEVHRAETWTDQQREKRHNVVARLLELLQSPQVKAGLIESNLPPGWQWTASYSDLVAEGKRLKAELSKTPAPTENGHQDGAGTT